MKITLLSDDAIRLEATAGMMTIEAASESQAFSPFHMMAAGLAVCTYAVLASWASHAKVSGDDLSVDVRWSFAEDPHRIGSYEVVLNWPSLPAQRHTVAKRVAELCAVKQTFSHPPTVTTEINAAAPAASGSRQGAAV
jgi:uncharacterized OsmC-like protein